MSELLKFLAVHAVASFVSTLAENAGGHLYHTAQSEYQKRARKISRTRNKKRAQKKKGR